MSLVLAQGLCVMDLHRVVLARTPQILNFGFPIANRALCALEEGGFCLQGLALTPGDLSDPGAKVQTAHPHPHLLFERSASSGAALPALNMGYI